MIEKIRAWIAQHREAVSYIVVGGITTVINYAVQLFCALVVQGHVAFNTTMAFLAAVAFAYFANKHMVFHSKTEGTVDTLREAGSFFLMRGVSFGIEMALMLLFVSVLHLPELVMKIPVNVVVLAANYVFSKLFIFRGAQKKPPERAQK